MAVLGHLLDEPRRVLARVAKDDRLADGDDAVDVGYRHVLLLRRLALQNKGKE